MAEQWTTADIPDLSGKVVIVTGANTGIGFETAKELARRGAHTVLACRSMARGAAALEAIRTDVPDAAVELLRLDLSDLASVRQFAETFAQRHARLDVLVNNAGIMMTPYGRTADGFERQLGVNHLGHFALTGLLLETLLGTPGARVVTVSSGAHRMGRMDEDQLMYDERSYSPAQAYGRSKLANLLFTYELQRRFEAAGSDAMALAAHPGYSATELTRHLAEHWWFKLARPIVHLFSQSAAIGALPTLRAAVDPAAEGAAYYGPDGFMEQRGYPVPVTSSAASHDEDTAQWLWAKSEELTGVSFEQLDVAMAEHQMNDQPTRLTA